MQLTTTVFPLIYDTPYVFDVTAVFISGYRVKSEVTGLVRTRPPCRPGLPRAGDYSITDGRVHLSCDKPSSCGETVNSYSIICWKTENSQKKLSETLSPHTK